MRSWHFSQKKNQKDLKSLDIKKELNKLLHKARIDGIDDQVLSDNLLLYQQELLLPMADMLSMAPSNLAKHILEIKMTDRDDLNSFMEKSDKGGNFQIFVNFGLLHFQYKIMKLFVAHFGIGEANNILEEPSLSDDYVTNAASHLLQAYWDGTIRSTATIKIMDLTESQITTMIIMMRTAEKYVVAHELGHIVTYLSSRPLDELQWGLAVAEGAIKAVGETKEKMVEKLATELAADLIGLRLVMNTVHDSSGILWTIVLGACESVFIIRTMLDRFKNVDEGKGMPTHPPAKFRNENLRAALKTDPGWNDSFFQFGDAIQALAQNILFRVKRMYAEQGDVQSQYWVAKAYEDGDCVKANDEEALKWLMRAAKGNQPDAQFAIGDRYYRGKGFTEDHIEAAKWFKRVADQGDSYAIFNFANALRTGDGVGKDERTAVDLYRISAEQGIPHAQANLACCLRDGIGVKRDIAEAYRWFLIANSSGLVDVSEWIQKLSEIIPKPERRKIEQLAANWRVHS